MIKIKNLMAYDHIKNIFKIIFKQIIETYLSILSLPPAPSIYGVGVVYRSKSKLIIVLMLVMVISSIVFNSGLYNYVSSNYGYLFVSATVLNILFLKFNFIIRLFNVFYKSVIYFYAAYRNGNSNNKIVPTLRVIIFYYLYNIICFVLTILLVLRLENNLAEYSNIIAEYSYIYSILIAPTFALMYIDYISEEEVGYNKRILNKISKLIHVLIIGSIIWSILIFNFNNPILCDTGNDNQQTNQNTQHNGETTRNIQNNANNQVVRTNLIPRSRTMFMQTRGGTNENLQGNINSQTIINNSSVGVSDETLISGNKRNPFPRERWELKISSKLKLRLDKNGLVTRSYQGNSTTLSQSMDSVVNRVNKLGVVHEQSQRLEFMHNLHYIRSTAFTNIHRRLLECLHNDVITKTKFNDYFSALIDLAYKQDVNNKILIDYKEELLDKDKNFFNLLNNKLIYMNNIYSAVVLDFKTDKYIALNYGVSSLADLYQANLDSKHELNLKLINIQLNENFNNDNILRAEHMLNLQFYNATICLNDLLETQYMNQINRILDNKFYVESIVGERHHLDNTFMYWDKFKLFTFKFVGYDDSVSYEIIPVDTKFKLSNYVYQSMVSNIQRNDFFFNLEKNKINMRIQAIRMNIHGIDGTDLSSRFSSDSESSVESSRQAIQKSSSNLSIFQNERTAANKLIGYVSNVFNKRG